jgi:hypothetical protein
MTTWIGLGGNTELFWAVLSQRPPLRRAHGPAGALEQGGTLRRVEAGFGEAGAQGAGGRGRRALVVRVEATGAS